MPLIQGKSEKSFSKNVATEMDAGKPQDQSLAIAYAVKRRAMKRKEAMGGEAEMMAKGGDVAKRNEHESGVHQPYGHAGESISGVARRRSVADPERYGSVKDAESRIKDIHKEKLDELKEMAPVPMMAEGGEIDEEDPGRIPDYRPAEPEVPEDEDGDMVSRIMRKRMSEGGMVANHEQAADEVDESMDEGFDVLAKDDDLEFSETGASAGDFLGDAREDMDRKDIVARIMKSRAMKDRLPKIR
jgi:hypothetical protein